MEAQLANPMMIDVPPQAVGGVLCVRMAGDVDIADQRELSLAETSIRGPGAQRVILDVGPVTFFGSTLVNFLVHLVEKAPGGQVVLCRPSPIARRVLGALTLPGQISIRPDLPPEWVEPAPPSSRDRPRVIRAAS